MGNVLKVYGAGFLAKELEDGKSDPVHDVFLPSKPFHLRFETPYSFLSSSEASWQLRFPYYFMIWNINHFTATNGLRTDMVIASTSFARHSDDQGQSQATIMFVYSPNADCAAFGRYWLGQLTLGPGDKTNTPPLPQGDNYRGYDSSTRMRKEVTLLGERAG